MSDHYTPHYPPRRPEGLPVRLVVLATAIAAGLLAVVLLVAVLAPRLDPLDRAQRQRQAYADLETAARLQPLDVLLAGAWRLLPLLVVGSGAVVCLRIAWRRWGAPESVHAHYVIKLAEAQRAHVPHSLTYSPHMAYRNNQEGLALPEPGMPALADVPTFAQLLDRGKLGAGRPLILGYDVETGQELTGSWLDLYSTAVSGMPGSGKTTSQRFLACQTALQGAQFAVCDPHAEAGEDSLAATLAPLRAAFVCEPASSDRAILDVVRYVADVGRRRVEGKDRSTTPLILWLDELTALLGRSSVADALGELLERIAQEYRKKQVFACASGQIWTAARTSSELRDSFASVLCHRMKRSQARLLLPTDEAETVERLEIGRAVLWRTSGATAIVQVPNTRADDVRRVGRLLSGTATARLPEWPQGSHVEAVLTPSDMPQSSHVVADAVRLPGASVRAEAARAAQMFLEGHDPAAIVAELRGVSSRQGGRYQQALAEVLGLIREGLAR